MGVLGIAIIVFIVVLCFAFIPLEDLPEDKEVNNEDNMG
jgi:hypothetical protein